MHTLRSERGLAALLVVVGGALAFPGRVLAEVGRYIATNAEERDELHKVRRAGYERDERKRAREHRRAQLARSLARKKRAK